MNLTLLREQTIRRLMPDRCQIMPGVGGNVTIDDSGVLHTDDPIPREWRGVTDIPCRFDLSRAFRPDKLKQQATMVDEFNLELPFDVTVEPGDKILIGGHQFEIRKLKNLSQWDITIEAVITETGTDYDYNQI